MVGSYNDVKTKWEYLEMFLFYLESIYRSF